MLGADERSGTTGATGTTGDRWARQCLGPTNLRYDGYEWYDGRQVGPVMLGADDLRCETGAGGGLAVLTLLQSNDGCESAAGELVRGERGGSGEVTSVHAVFQAVSASASDPSA
jgi:hypothetical protein